MIPNGAQRPPRRLLNNPAGRASARQRQAKACPTGNWGWYGRMLLSRVQEIFFSSLPPMLFDRHSRASYGIRKTVVVSVG